MADVQYKFPSTVNNSVVTMDLESNGLLFEKKEYSASKGLIIHPPADKIWMVCNTDAATNTHFDFIDPEILKKYKRSLRRLNRLHGRENVHIYPLDALPQYYEKVKQIRGHNLMKFDRMIIEKLLGYSIPFEKVFDTLIASQTQLTDREHVEGCSGGPHSVEAYGIRFNGIQKQAYEEWRVFQEDCSMYSRCFLDVHLQVKIYDYLRDERESDRLECNINWDKPLEIEHKAAYHISYSELYGFKIDKKYAEGLVESWDKRLSEIEDELLPEMPFKLSKEGCGTLINWDDYKDKMISNTNLTRLPIGFCWPEGSGNKPQPIWNPFKKDGSTNEHVNSFFLGKDATEYVPEEPERFAKPAILDDDGKVLEKPVRARKARPAKEAKPRKPSCYEDDAGLTSPPIIKMTPEDVGGPFTRIQWNHYNLGSNNQVVEYLTKYTDWKPNEFTDKGNPKVTEDSFDSIGKDGVGDLLREYLITKSRRTTIKNFKDKSKGWLNNVRDDGYVTPINNTIGTPTCRSRHSVIVNIAGGSAWLGKEMRSCWIAKKSCKIIGIDAAAIEARAMAHEIDCEETKDIVVNGDFHTLVWNQIPDFSSSRGNTKGIEYALLYGASDQKLGSLADVAGCKEEFASKDKLSQRGWIQDTSGKWRHKNWNPKKDSLLYKEAQETVCGSIIRMRIMEGLKPLGAAIERFVKLSEKGYLKAIDGRKLNCRSSHSAFNLRLQSTGAIICKTAYILTMERLKENGLVVYGKDHDPSKHVELYTFYHKHNCGAQWRH